MNLYLRLIWTLLRAAWLPKMHHEETLTRSFRVLPNDIDLNRHMNNGRYLTMLDLMIVEFFLRTGFLQTMLRMKWYPVVGGSVITYRKELALAQKYRIRYRWSSCDDKWNYLHFDFLNEAGQICASGYSKGAAKSRKGIVPCAEAFKALGVDPEIPPLPAPVTQWRAAEAGLMTA